MEPEIITKRMVGESSSSVTDSTLMSHYRIFEEKQNGYLRYLFKIFDKFIDL